MKDLKIPAEAKGSRLDHHLRDVLPDLSRNHIQKSIERGEILVDGKEVTAHHFLKGGETVSFVAPAAAAEAAPTVEVPVLAVEKDYLVIDKPSGIAVHPGAGIKATTVTDALVLSHPEIRGVGESERPGIVHRLDKDVSGIMIVARTARGLAYFKEAFKERRMGKTYVALVAGEPTQESGTIDRPIARSNRRARMSARTPGQGGKDAVTHWNVLERFKNATLLEVKIETGRTHQIRAHLFSVGMPIIGDPLYKVRTGKPSALKRPFLHSAKIEFIDPDGVARIYESPLPKGLKDHLSQLKTK